MHLEYVYNPIHANVQVSSFKEKKTQMIMSVLQTQSSSPPPQPTSETQPKAESSL